MFKRAQYENMKRRWSRYVKLFSNPKKFTKAVLMKLFNIYHKMDERHYAKQDAKYLSVYNNVLFVDLGANLGQGYRWFKKYFYSPNISFELFEPNPNCFVELQKIQDFKRGAITFHNCGVGALSGEFEFFGLDNSEGGPYSQSGSVVKDHNSNFYKASGMNSIKVNIIDFSEYLVKKSHKYDKIIVKMDIEGAEVELLEHLIANGAVNHINVLYVEFHSQYQVAPNSQINKQRELAILKSLKSNANIKVRIWH
jgi:FkbM family methyltransferase